MDNLQLKEIAKSIELVTEKVDIVTKQTKVLNIEHLNNKLKIFYTEIIKKNKESETRLVALVKAQLQLKIYLDGFKNGFPLETKQHLIVSTVLKFHIYLYTLFICLLISFSIFITNHYKDTTDYKKAWIELINLEQSNENREMLNNILEKNNN